MAGFKTFGSANLTSSDVNGYLMRQTVIQCTSSTRPSSPHEGMLIFETDTDRYASYTGSAWVYVAWNSATGRIGFHYGTPYAPGTVNQDLPNAGWQDVHWYMFYPLSSPYYDPASFRSGSGGIASQPVAPVTGLYSFEANVNFTTAWSDTAASIRLDVAGRLIYRGGNTERGYITGTWGQVEVAAGETIKVQLYQASGSTRTMQTSGSYFRGRYVAA